MPKYTLTINQQLYQAQVEADTPLLWVLRDELALLGTKYGCGKGLCGACTVHVNGQAMRSCQLPVSVISGQAITTIEGIASVDNKQTKLHPIQQAWLDLDVPQCGYCQSGQIMTAVALLKNTPEPSVEQIESAMAGNICRCGTYVRIRQAIQQAAQIPVNNIPLNTAAESKIEQVI